MSLKDELTALSDARVMALRRIDDDRSLSAEGKATQRAAVDGQYRETVSAITAGAKAAVTWKREAAERSYSERQRAHAQSFDVTSAAYALERARLVAEHGDLPSIQAAIGQAVAAGDRYAVTAWQDLIPLVTNRFQRDDKSAFAVMEARRELETAASGLEPADLVVARQRLEAAQGEEAEIQSAANNLVFQADFVGDRATAAAVLRAMAPPSTPPEAHEEGQRWFVEQPAGEAWLG